MKNPPCKSGCDRVDLAAALALAFAVSFAATFFWQASAGADRGEASYLEELRRQAALNIAKERSQISHLLALEEEGESGEVRREALESYDLYRGNSQFHLLLAGVHERGESLAAALGEYRRALEKNREYSDRRSPHYRGDSLQPLLGRAKAAFVERGEALSRDVRKAAVSDLFYIERSLAGGCH